LGRLIIRRPCLLCFVAICMLAAIPALAQTTSLSGIVTDAADAAAPHASLILTGISGAERATVSNEAGFFRFVQLTPNDLRAMYPVGINSATLAVLADAAKKYPANDNGVGDGLNTGGYRFNASTPLHYNAHTATMNFNLTRDGRQTLLVRGNFQQDSTVGTPQFPDTPGTNLWSHPVAFAVQHTWTATNALVNTLRLGLTRESFSQQGDSSDNQISFRFVYSPKAFARTLAQTVPVWNIVDNVAWVKGNHTFAFGGNVRIIRNRQTSFAGSFDTATINPNWYDESGGVLTDPITNLQGSEADLQGALAAVIGRYSYYSSSFNFGPGGNLLTAGSGVGRNWAD